MQRMVLAGIILCLLFCFGGCDANIKPDSATEASKANSKQGGETESPVQMNQSINDLYITKTKISDVMADPVFENYGRLIFPVDEGYYSGETLGDLRLTWYSNIDPEKTVEIANYMKDHAASGDIIFFDIYTDEEKAADPEKKNTGLFFFRGNPGEKFAICNAGGGFAYVAAMQDSFPHALELSKQGYNAFALIYRPGVQTACEDLARAVRFVFEHAEKLEIDTDCYSCGAAVLEPEWLPILAHMGRRLLVVELCQSQVRL